MDHPLRSLVANAKLARNAERCIDLGLAALNIGEVEVARSAFEAAVELDPSDADAWNLKGVACRRLGELQTAVECYRQAVARGPDFGQAWNNLGVCFQEQGKILEAANAYKKAIANLGGVVEPLVNGANLCRHLGELNEAESYCVRAIQIDANDTRGWLQLGRVLITRQDFARARDALSQVVARQPRNADAHYYLGLSFEGLGLPQEALEAFERALECDPLHLAALDSSLHQKQFLCHWEKLDDLTQRLVSIASQSHPTRAVVRQGDLIAPFSLLTAPIPVPGSVQRQTAELWTQTIAIDNTVDDAIEKSRIPDRERIRLGYLSNDFYSHATTALLTELIEAHDRTRFEVFGYSFRPCDKTRPSRRIRTAFDHFVDIEAESYATSASRIAADQIDILFDLKGYTQGARPQILALRPAKIQINFLGYPGTSGAPWIDYMIADEFVIPVGAEAKPIAGATSSRHPDYTEEIIHLQGCYQVNDSHLLDEAERTTRSDHGLPEAHFVFAAFNSHYKITQTMFDIWMRLLMAIPNSLLWLSAGSDSSQINLRREANRRGVDAQRLVFAPRLPMLQHIERQRHADLFLDTFPVCAHTTASDALRVGLPMVTLVGENMISRVAGSLLCSLNLPELITTDLRSYEATARELALNPGRLQALRTKLHTNLRSTKIFSGVDYAARLEAVLKELIRLRRTDR